MDQLGDNGGNRYPLALLHNGLAMISKIETRTIKLLTNIGFY